MLDFIKRKIARSYITSLLKKEYEHPPFNVFNERPVEYRFVFEQIAEFYPETILDVGTGFTSLPHLMANCGCKVTAIDNVKDFWTGDMYNRHYYVINDDITDSKLRSTFDMVTCISTLEHIKEYDKAVKTMCSLLNPKGALVMTFPYNENQFVQNVYDLPGSHAQKGLPYTTSAYSRREIERWCTENGMTLVGQEFWQFYEGDYWTIGARLPLPKETDKTQKHQITCIVLQKTKL